MWRLQPFGASLDYGTSGGAEGGEVEEVSLGGAEQECVATSLEGVKSVLHAKVVTPLGVRKFGGYSTLADEDVGREGKFWGYLQEGLVGGFEP